MSPTKRIGKGILRMQRQNFIPEHHVSKATEYC